MKEKVSPILKVDGLHHTPTSCPQALFLQRLLDSSLDVICSVDKEGCITFVSAACYPILGYTSAELLGRKYIDFVVEEDVAKTIAVAAEVIGGRNVTHFENRYRRKDGSIVPVLWSCRWSSEDELLYATAKDLSEKKKLEEEEQNKLHAVYDNMQECFFTLDRNFIVTFWNASTEKVLGKKKEEIIGKHLWSEYGEAVSLKYFTEYNRALQENTPVHFEEYLPSVDGWFEVNAYPYSDGLSVYFQDITHRKKQEVELMHANERYEYAAKATSDALWDWDIKANTCYFNDTYTTLFGYENNNDLIFNNWIDKIHSEDKLRIVNSVETALADKSKTQWQDEYRFYKQDNSICHVLDRATIIRDENGSALRVVGAMQDITMLRKAHEELEKLSLIAKETENSVIITDEEERIIWVNKAFTTLSGYMFEEVKGRKPNELLQGPHTSIATKSYIKTCIKAKRPFNCEILNYTKQGHEYWVEIKGQPIFDEQGKFKQFFAIQTDITARKQADILIRTSQEKYKLLFDRSPRPKWILETEEMRIVEVNEAAINLYGYSKEEFLELKAYELKEKGCDEEIKNVVADLKSGKITFFKKQVPHKKKSGKIFYIELTVFTINLESGVHIIVTGDDLTEKLRLEQEVLNEKIAKQKEISRAIIGTQEKERSEIGKELHDNVCQLLTTSKLYMENINYFQGQKEIYIDKSISIIQQSINEIRFLSKQLVTPIMNDIGFEATINELISHYEALCLFKVNFNYDADENLIDKELQLAVYRIFQEQFNNSVKYAKASCVDIAIRIVENKLVVDYKDNGIGFDPKTVKGGIGLKNIKNRADAYKGKININTALGKGCQTNIIFPLSYH